MELSHSAYTDSSIYHFCKFICLISVNHMENEEYSLSDQLYHVDFTATLDRILFSRLTINYLNHFFSSFSAVLIFECISSKFFTNWTFLSTLFWFILTARLSCAVYEAGVFWEKWCVSHTISLHRDSPSQEEEKIGYIGNVTLLTSLSLIWSC